MTRLHVDWRDPDSLDDLYEECDAEARRGRSRPKTVCRKQRFPSKRAAEELIRWAARRRRVEDDPYIPVRAYACGACRGWHVTSQPAPPPPDPDRPEPPDPTPTSQPSPAVLARIIELRSAA